MKKEEKKDLSWSFLLVLIPIIYLIYKGLQAINQEYYFAANLILGLAGFILIMAGIATCGK